MDQESGGWLVAHSGLHQEENQRGKKKKEKRKKKKGKKRKQCVASCGLN
jgi:hypothetical protein